MLQLAPPLSRRLALPAVLLIAVLVPASQAGAAAITYSGSVLTYDAAPGERNSPLVSVNEYASLCDPVPAPCLSILDSGIPMSFPAALCAGGAGEARCVMPSSVVANLGDRDDSYWDWDGDSTIDGGPGNDIPLNGNGGDDVIRGGIGGDILYGQLGDDLLDGGPGDDYLEGVPGGAVDEWLTVGRDTYVGGGGTDSVTYEGRSEDLVLSVDGVADDGAPGEGDDIGADVTTVQGGHGADAMLGGPGRNVFGGGPGDDELTGRDGDDQLSGGSGNDRVHGDGGQDVLGGDAGDDLLTGGADVDTFYGDEVLGCIPALCASGEDRIHARDGNREKLHCGPGTDAVEADAVDWVVDEVESSDRCESGAPGAPAAADAFRVTGASVDRRKRIVVRLAVPEAGTVRVRAGARVRGARVGVGRASRAVAGAGALTLRVAPSRAARRALRVAKRLKVSVRIAFSPRTSAPPSTHATSVVLRHA